MLTQKESRTRKTIRRRHVWTREKRRWKPGKAQNGIFEAVVYFLGNHFFQPALTRLYGEFSGWQDRPNITSFVNVLCSCPRVFGNERISVVALNGVTSRSTRRRLNTNEGTPFGWWLDTTQLIHLCCCNLARQTEKLVCPQIWQGNPME